LRIIGKDNFLDELEKTRKDFQSDYYAMYSSVLDGIVKDPVCMMVPIDDHIVHRGDGIFEAFNCFEGKIFNLEGHLKRMEASCRLLEYDMPFSIAEMTDIIKTTVFEGGHKDCTVRPYVSRGQGSFGVNPYDCKKSNFYVVVTKRIPFFMDRHPAGALVALSKFPPKKDIFARSKNCNYIVNVMMKKEAVDSGVDFVVSVSEDGYVAEGSTENIGLINQDNWLLFPEIDGVLAGTTMLRAMALGQELVGRGVLSGVAFAKLEPKDFECAKEVMMVGTTLNVTSVCSFCDKGVSGGKPGAISKMLNDMLFDDIYGNDELATNCF
jgi:branched-subunit amino acid aminotransferase/4-amino-4-deoxychorismate lyase